MATKLYLESSGTPSISPTPNAGWTNVNQFTRFTSRTIKQSSTMTTKNITDALSDQQDIIIGQWISPSLTTGQTITGAQTVSCQARFSETSNSNNLFLVWAVYIFNGTTLQQTVITKRNDGTEVVLTTLTNRTDSTTSVAGNYTTVKGDQIVIEIGLEGNPSGTAVHDGSMSYGSNSATDLPSDDSTIAADNPNVILNDTLTFTHEISVFDSITVTDVRTVDSLSININVFDSITVSESVTMLLQSFVSVSDAITITESVTVTTSLGDVNVFDSITITESVTVSVVSDDNTLSINIFDSITISESVTTENSTGYINVFDSVNIAENLSETGQSNINIFDSVSISENVTAENSLAFTDIFDSINITESSGVNPPSAGFDIVISDSIDIAENTTFLLHSFIDILDGLTLTENTTILTISFINVFDLINVTENFFGTNSPLNLSVLSDILIIESAIPESFRFSPSRRKPVARISVRNPVGEKGRSL